MATIRVMDSPSGKGKGFAMGIETPGSPSRYDTVSLAPESLDDPEVAAKAYIAYNIKKSVLIAGNIDPWTSTYHDWAADIFVCYFLGSFLAHPASYMAHDPENVTAWRDALWEMRSAFGKDFMDKAMVSVMRTFKDDPRAKPGETFNNYFRARFTIGEFVIDNDLTKHNIIGDILKKRNLDGS